MIDLKLLEKNEPISNGEGYQDAYRRSIKGRGGDELQVDKLLELNKRRKAAIAKAEAAKAKQNKVSQEIALKKRNKEDASELLEQMQKFSKQTKDLEHQAAQIGEELEQFLLELPNQCHPDVAMGRSEEDNKLIKEWGEPRTFDFKPKEHYELGEALGILDFERAGKVTGARFCFLKGAAAKLERALIQFMIDIHTQQHGYAEMMPPFIINSESLKGTGQFPKFKEDVFHLQGFDYHLSPTAEVPLTNYYAGEILNAEDLPQKFVAFSPCFRSEAGSHGKDTRGLIRQHQFNKVEMVIFCRPEDSYKMHDEMTASAERILQLLELPYRVVSLCTGDLGFSAAKCHDLEVYLPGQNRYREISSCSNCEDFQARRAGIRFRPEPKAKPQFVHTLNGSGLAVGRTLIAILENYQQADGKIDIPEILVPYMGGQTQIG